MVKRETLNIFDFASEGVKNWAKNHFGIILNEAGTILDEVVTIFNEYGM